MSFSDQIVINTVAYDVTIRNSRSTVRGVAGLPIGEPQALTISHEKSKDGKRSNILVKLDETHIDAGDNVTLANASAHLKISFDNQVNTEAQVQAIVAAVVAFATPANVTKLLNGEH